MSSLTYTTITKRNYNSGCSKRKSKVEITLYAITSSLQKKKELYHFLGTEGSQSHFNEPGNESQACQDSHFK